MLAGRPFDGRAGVYSLGCTLFRLLTGKTPFSAANGMPPKVTERMPELSVQMDAVIATALAKDPAQRFPSGRALAAAAAEALADRSVPTTAPWQPIPGGQVDSYPPASQPAAPPWWQHTGGIPTVLAPAGRSSSGPQPPPPAPSPSPPRKRRRWWIAAALATVIAAAAASIATVTLWARSPSPRPGAATSSAPALTGPPPVPVTALPAILLTPDQAAGAVGSDKMVVSDTEALPYDSVALISDPQCVGVWMPAEHAAYANTGWTAVQSQRLHDDNDKPYGHEVIQAVIAFPSAAVAEKAVADQTAQWSACAGRSYPVGDKDHPSQDRTFGPLTTAGGTSAIVHTMAGTLHLGCQHALAVRNNLAIDVAACRVDVTNQGIDVLNAIAAKVPMSP